MKHLLTAAATIVAALIVGVASPAYADVAPQDLQASLTVVEPNYTTVESVFSALGSNGGDIRGINSFTFDFGDGTAPLTQESAIAGHTYAKPGTYTATVTMTNDFDVTATASTTFTVSGIEEIGKPMFPAEGAPQAKATLDQTSVVAGGTVTVTVPALPDNAEFGATLVPPTKQDPWVTAGIASAGPFKVASGKLVVPATAKPGDYTVTVRISDGSMTALKLRVETGPLAVVNNVLRPVGGIAGGGVIVGALLLVVAAAVTVPLLVRRKRKSGAAQ